jgi:hypothetical protein
MFTIAVNLPRQGKCELYLTFAALLDFDVCKKI